MSTQELQHTTQQLQPRIDAIRSELDRVEQQVRFQMQTSGYPTSTVQPESVQRFSEVDREINSLRERIQTFSREATEKIDQVTRTHQQAQQSVLSGGGSSYASGGGSSSSAQWAQSLIQVVRETLDVTSQAFQALSRASGSQSSGSPRS